MTFMAYHSEGNLPSHLMKAISTVIYLFLIGLFTVSLPYQKEIYSIGDAEFRQLFVPCLYLLRLALKQITYYT